MKALAGLLFALLVVASCAPAVDQPIANGEETYVGIGIQLEPMPPHLPGGFFVVDVLPGSPAARAGVPLSAQLLEVDGIDVLQLTAEEVVELVRGPEGTAVHLLLIEQGADAATEFELVRERIAVPRP